MTDAFTKYVELVALPNKEALTVTSAIFNRWICRFGLPLEIVTDQGREFNNKLSEELYSLLRLHHQTTAARHPQCNSQAEVCNKTIAKYLNSFVDSTTLNWEQFLAPLMFSYNTSFHRSVKNTPYFLTFGMDPRLPSFPNPDLREKFYGESSAADMFQKLQVARQLATENNLLATNETKISFDKHAKPHSFAINQLVLLEEYNFLGKNPKLSPKWSGPHIILSLKGTHNAEILMNNKRKVIVNIERLKPYLSQNLLKFSDTEEALSKQSSPPEHLFTSSEHPTPEQITVDDEQIPEQINKSAFPALPAQHPPPVKRKRGRPPGPRPPTPPPQISKNDGGICTRSQTARKNAMENDRNINTLKYTCLPCFENCVNNRHSKSCLQKAVNFMEKGDIYTSQKAYHRHNLDLNFNEEGALEEEIEDEQNDLGLGGSSPIPSIHHSFDADETLQDIQEVEDEFEEEEEEDDFIDEQDIEEKEKEIDESFLSTLEEFHSINDTLNDTISAQTTPERKEEEIHKVLTETNKLKNKCEKLLPKISPGLRREVYRKIDWSTFKLQEPISLPTGAGPSTSTPTSTPTRSTRSSGSVPENKLPSRPLEYKQYSKRK
jgi:hypothetical protein